MKIKTILPVLLAVTLIICALPVSAAENDSEKCRVRFFRDAERTIEFADKSQIEVGDAVYYSVETDPGYICTSVSLNVVFPLNYDGDFGHFTADVPGNDLEIIATSALAGDINWDGKVNLRDVAILLKSFADPELFYSQIFYNRVADIDANGEYNLRDVALLMRFVAGWNVSIDENERYDLSFLVKAKVIFAEPATGDEFEMTLRSYKDVCAYITEHGGTVPEFFDQDYWSEHYVDKTLVRLSDHETEILFRYYLAGEVPYYDQILPEVPGLSEERFAFIAFD